ncbi:unnamed protein product [Urochloa decumbens]|uniref:Uncharacterized protein n=1 Tax=Urochloa decumbens TaxID=240449 RepID=A0ABC9EHV6_9POAL
MDVLGERMAKATEKLEADFSKVDTKISRFPHVMRGIGGHGSYIAPIVAAILGQDQDGSLKTEGVKLAAAYNLCRRNNSAAQDVYGKVLSVVGAARDCYDADDPTVVGVSDADFATIMFVDGCFLVQYMVVVGVSDTDEDRVLHNPMIRRQILSMGASIQKDVFLLENQIPWLVLDAIVAELVPAVDVRGFVHMMGAMFVQTRRTGLGGGNGNVLDHYKPPHLLGLLRSTLVGCMPHQVMLNFRYHGSTTTGSVQSLMSATYLNEIGVILTPSTEPRFGDMSFGRLPVNARLFLSPVFLNHVTACCLVNMAALEAMMSTEEEASNESAGGSVVTSYLSVLTMLMDGMEDVQELRRKGLLQGPMSDMQALVFFKALRRHLRFGVRHMLILEEIQSYCRHKSVRIAVQRFTYRNFYGTAAAIISITNVVSSICTVLQTFKNGSNK